MPQKLTDDQIQEVVERYKQGEGGTTIAKDYPVTHNAIYGLLDRRGVERRSVSETLSADWSEVADQYCKHCGELIEPTGNPKRYLKRDYCSRGCQAEGRVKTRYTHTCQQCGDTFRNLREEAKYCSDDCADAAKVTSEIVECPNCGENYREVRHKIEREGPAFCSNECYRAWNRGENSPLWKGGKDGYRGENWQQARQKALFRYGSRCVVCGDDERPNVHHMIPFREFKDVERANAVGNLIVLCPKHHTKADRHYDQTGEILYDHS